MTQSKSSKSAAQKLEHIISDLSLGLAESPHGTDKLFPKMYVSEFYDPLVERFEVSRILEIGVRGGASLRMWSQYLDQAPGGEVIGIDDFSDATTPRADWVDGDKIKIVHGDAYDPELVSGLEGRFDLIIDDGPHDLESQKEFLRLYWPLVSAGGVLVVEDIIGGKAYLADLVRSLPIGSRQCVSSVDLRRVSDCSDALLLVVHNCDRSLKQCSLPEVCKSENGLAPRVARTVTVLTSGLKAGVKRILRASRWGA